MKRLIAMLMVLCMFVLPAMADTVYPLTDAPKLKVWIPMDAGNSQMYTNYVENPVWQEFMRVTGVEIEFEHPTYGANAEGFAKVLSGNQLPDIMIDFASSYNGGVETAFEDGAIHDLTPYLEEYAPAYYALINQSADVRKQFYTEDGKCLAFYLYSYEPNPAAMSVFVRADWCREFGMNPADLDTYEEIGAYFQAILDNKPGVIPFMPTLMNSDAIRAQLWGHDLTNTFFAEEGKTTPYAVSERYKEWLKLYRDWYTKGYIGIDFATTKAAQARKMFAAGQVGCILTATGNAYADAQAAGIEIDKSPYWLKNEDMTVHTYYLGVDLNAGIGSVVTTAVDEKLLPVICQFMDYCYTADGAIFSCWGPEGISWDWVDGERKHNDWVLNNPNNTTSVMHNVCRLNYWPRMKYADATCNPNVIKDEVVREMRTRYTIMDNYQTDWYIPAGVSYTAEEAADRDKIMTDVNTHVNEMMYKFIKSEADIDADWDNYSKTLEKFDLSEALDIVQTAYDRYMSR